MRLMQMIAALFLMGAVAAMPAWSVEPDEMLSDPKLEQRARGLSAELRCLVCQNQSIDDSNAPLAKDLRLLVRERLKAGDSDDAVRSFLVARYGEFVLLKPPVGMKTLLLWATPFAVLLGILAYLWRTLWSNGARTAPAGGGSVRSLTEAEERRLRELLDDEQTPTKAG